MLWLNRSLYRHHRIILVLVVMCLIFMVWLPVHRSHMVQHLLTTDRGKLEVFLFIGLWLGGVIGAYFKAGALFLLEEVCVWRFLPWWLRLLTSRWCKFLELHWWWSFYLPFLLTVVGRLVLDVLVKGRWPCLGVGWGLAVQLLLVRGATFIARLHLINILLRAKRIRATLIMHLVLFTPLRSFLTTCIRLPLSYISWKNKLFSCLFLAFIKTFFFLLILMVSRRSSPCFICAFLIVSKCFFFASSCCLFCS